MLFGFALAAGRPERHPDKLALMYEARVDDTENEPFDRIQFPLRSAGKRMDLSPTVLWGLRPSGSPS